ncbi:thioredoxin-like protein [Suillus bovinus]|uniref:thioredoxin-like protein n=1 Tax=Suillus bovinus TaxID=48563 RepID=UPI001B882CEA|nr:thioredoxin-like protein [Suillus bovinus]KAG2135925.1 thioredoxin-like protein [Suillus bovinus]
MPSLRLGNIAPDFEADTTAGPIKFHEWIGNSWAILFSHPGDFTPVCTTELGEVARRASDFAKRDVKVIGISANGLQDHHKWVEDISDFGAKYGPTNIADEDRTISVLYDMLDEQDATNRDGKGLPFTIRSVFVIDPKKVIRLIIAYPASTGRNFDEIIRVVDSHSALQLGDKHRITTPVNWKNGEDVIVHPSVTNDEAKVLFPEVTFHKQPYLRTTPLKDEQNSRDRQKEILRPSLVSHCSDVGFLDFNCLEWFSQLAQVTWPRRYPHNGISGSSTKMGLPSIPANSSHQSPRTAPNSLSLSVFIMDLPSCRNNCYSVVRALSDDLIRPSSSSYDDWRHRPTLASSPRSLWCCPA